MGLRFRRRISFGRFLRLNLSGSGASLGLGPRGANVNVSRRGTRTSFGLPGSGLSYQTQRSWSGGRRRGERPAGTGPGIGAMLAAVAVVAAFALLAHLLYD
jgi:hypothetical protein